MESKAGRIKKIVLSRKAVKSMLHLPIEVDVVHEVAIFLQCYKFPDVSIYDVKNLESEDIIMQVERKRVVQIGDVKFE